MIRDLKALRHFVVLAETLHFGRAAALLHTTQPPLSRQVAALEAELGLRLFARNARHVSLTPAGERFLADVRTLLAGLDQAVVNARAAASGEAGRLAIGFTMAAAYTVVPRYARRFSAAFPRVALALREIVSSDLAARVLEGRVDAAIMFPVQPQAGLRQAVVFRDKLVLAMPRGHRLARRKSIRLRDFANEAFVAAPRDVSPFLRTAIEQQCRAEGFEPDIHMEAQLQQTVLSLVAEGVGVALVPGAMRRLRIPEVTFKPVPHAMDIEQVLAWSTSNINPCLQSFLDLAGVRS